MLPEKSAPSWSSSPLMGNMIPYMVSYLRIHSQSKDLRNTGAIWIQSAALAGQAVGMAISGGLQLKFSTRVTTVIGGCVMSCGVAVTYFSIDQSFWLLLFTYGFLFGVGLGIAYTPAFACAMKWLPAKKGLVTGLVQMGFGAGAFVLNQIQTIYINPENLTPDEAISNQSNEKYFTQVAVLERVPTCFLMLAGSYAGLQILGCCLISDPPATEEDLEVTLDDEDSDSTTTTRFSRKPVDRGEVNSSFVQESCHRIMDS
ncbi:uncharacterized protein LOC135479869 [Liolophura sinensis]|uniref:uncharacterized protein LOC135479869 n=1 Tax=Liolophura sinensis TaxID=3198878 RepID=UPI003158568A